MRPGNCKFDVFFPTIDILGKLVTAQADPAAAAVLHPAPGDRRLRKVPEPVLRPDWRYTVPYDEYITGIAYRRDSSPTTRSAAWPTPGHSLEPTYKGKVGIYDDYRESISMALLKNGITDLNTTNSRTSTRAERR